MVPPWPASVMILAAAWWPLKTADDVEVHDLRKLLGRVVQKGRALGDAGIVDDRVQATHIGGGPRKGLGHGLERGEVARAAPDLGLGIGGGKLFDGGIGSLLARSKDRDGGAFLDKAAGDGIADTARASGDDCFLTLEQHRASILGGGTYTAQRSGDREGLCSRIGERPPA